MAPGRPRRPSSSSSCSPSNGVRRPYLRRPPSEPIFPSYRGLPEHLYQAYERLTGYPTAPNHPLLIEAESGHELSFAQFRSLAAVLATSMLSRLGIRVGDTVAIYSTPNIDMLVVCAAAWLVGASVFAIAPETNAEGLRSSITQLHTLRTLFVTQALQPTVAQAFAHRQHLLYQRPVVVTTDATTQDPTPPANFTLHDLYTPRPDETPLERAPFTQNEAQDHTAVIYGVFTRNGVDQETSIDMIHLSHNTAISSYDEANLQTQAPSSLLEYRPLPLAYSVLRLHYAYYLHRIVLDIFRRGGSYLVASAFDPAEFVALVHRYQLEHAELTTTEIERLIAYLSAHRADQRQAPPSRSRPGSLRSSSSAEMLGSLRFIYIASTTPELVQDLEELLPHVELVRARYGSYLDPADLHRRM